MLKFQRFLKYEFTNPHKMTYKRNFEEFDEIKNDLKNKSETIKKDVNSISYQEFTKLLAELNISIRNRFVPNQHSVSIDTVANLHIMNCWLIDKTQAIFGFIGNINTRAREIAFYTQDAQIINHIILLSNTNLTEDPYGEYISNDK